MSSPALNSLARASSAYLRSAMHQPIQWHEWGEEAFATAQRENKPILLDIGAVWCHWCHVMDRESYDSPEIAQIVNERFVAVKVDRDERPDIDIRYQTAVQAVSGQGGWPLTAFLTPDGRPFYGGTYFPPSDGYGRPSFKRVLLAISDAYREKNGDVLEQAKMLRNAVAQAESFSAQSSGEFSPAVVDAIVESILKMYDAKHGGFGSAPKFPHPAALDLLIDRYVRTGDEHLRNVFVTTLEKMAQGGVYDQLAGGFHRYSVDERWVVPHFEKMCYDNSELLKNYVHAYQATGSEFFASVAKDIIRWMDEWLSDREKGGFYASQDADCSMDDDGDYFTWTVDEAKEVLTEEEAQVASLRYDINEIGEMHHNPAKNVLFVRASRRRNRQTAESAAATRRELTPVSQAKNVCRAAQAADSLRGQDHVHELECALRVGVSGSGEGARPGFGEALGIARAGPHFGRSLAATTGLLHVIAYSDAKCGAARDSGIAGRLRFHDSGLPRCLRSDCRSQLFQFRAPHRGSDDRTFFRCAKAEASSNARNCPGTRQNALGVLGTRRKPFQDSPTPAGNSMAAIALLRLACVYQRSRLTRSEPSRRLELLAGMAGQYGLFAATYGIAAVYFSQPHTQVVVVGSGEAADRLYACAVQQFNFGKAVLRFTADKIVPQNLPPALGRNHSALAANRKREGRSVTMLRLCLPGTDLRTGGTKPSPPGGLTQNHTQGHEKRAAD